MDAICSLLCCKYVLCMHDVRITGIMVKLQAYKPLAPLASARLLLEEPLSCLGRKSFHAAALLRMPELLYTNGATIP